MIFVWCRHSQNRSVCSEESRSASQSHQAPLRISEWEGTQYVAPVKYMYIHYVNVCVYVIDRVISGDYC